MANWDEVVAWLALIGLVGLVGWVLGIVGFFRARRALGLVVALERRLAVEARVVAAAPEAAPIFEGASVVVEPVMETVPVVAAVTEPVTVASGAAGSFEARLTMRLGVWLGAAALLLAGVFLVRYAADAGLLGPPVRCAMACFIGRVSACSARSSRMPSFGPIRAYG